MGLNKIKTMKIKVNYIITDNGDGSASAHFVKSFKDAEVYDDFRQIVCGGGFGESESFTEEFEVDKDGNIIDGLLDVKQILEEFLGESYNSVEDKEQVKELLKRL